MSTTVAADEPLDLGDSLPVRIDAEDRYHASFAAAPFAILNIDPHGRLIEANPAWRELLGVDAADGREFHLADFGYQHDAAEGLRLFAELRDGIRHRYQQEAQYRRTDGVIIWIRLAATAVHDASGAFLYSVTIMEDITASKQVESALRDREARYALATMTAGVSVWDLDLATGIDDADPVLCSMLGLPQGNWSWRDRLHPDDRARVLEHEVRARASDAPRDTRGDTPIPELEVRLIHADGEVRWFAMRATVLRGPEGNPYRIIGTLTGITARKHTQEALQHAYEFRDRVLESTVVAIAALDQKGRFVLLNDLVLEITGYTAAELIGRTADHLLPPDQREAVLGAIAMTLVTGTRVTRFDTDLLRKDGTTRRISFSLAPLMADGSIVGAVCTAEDISERWLAEGSLRRGERRYRALFEQASDAILISAEDGTFLDANGQAVTLLGYRRDELLTLKTTAVLTATDEQAMESLRQLRAGHTLRQERMVRRKDGTLVPVEVVARLLEDGRVQAIARDITERRRAEEELRRLSGQLLHIQDEERRRIARELHDGMAQDIFAITLNLARIQQRLAAGEPDVHTLLIESRTLGEQALREIRTLSYLLHPPLLDQLGLISAVRWYVDGFSERSGITVELDAPDHFGRLPTEVELALFRVIQESLANIHRHSGSTRARIKLGRHPYQATLRVQDYGQGFSWLPSHGSQDGAAALGVGIPGMRERLRQLGGRLEIASDTRGTIITAIVPLEATGGRSM